MEHLANTIIVIIKKTERSLIDPKINSFCLITQGLNYWSHMCDKMTGVFARIEDFE